MSALGLTFASPFILFGLLALPLIWWLLRLTPPRPKEEVFPPTRILEQVAKQEETPAQSPWWLTLLRLLMAALIILALADPVRNALEKGLGGEGPILLVMDDGWTGGLNWTERKASAENVIREAGDASRPVIVAFASDGAKADLAAKRSDEVLALLAAAEPKPVRLDLKPLAGALRDQSPQFTTAVWMTNGLQSEGTEDFAKALTETGATETIIYQPATDTTMALSKVANEPDAMVATISRAGTSADQAGTLTAFDVQGRSLASTDFSFAGNERETTGRFALPVELRNEFVRIAISDSSTAAAVQLLDERFRRRRVGLISGANADQAQQPLLSPLYYISRALSPFSEVREAESSNRLEAVTQLIDERANTLVFADIGKLPPEAETKLRGWIEAGGVLVRFAGPRLAAADDDGLTPVQLRRGGRNLGGTLTWGTPQPLASFGNDSPFSGIPVPEDVAVTRQVLAEPDIDLEEKTWASLGDGTPLVTAIRQGSGWIVLFHVTADAAWSNLPLSGAFVDMLRRIVAISNGAVSTGKASNTAVGEKVANAEQADAVLSPLRTLNGYGLLGAPDSTSKPLTLKTGEVPSVSIENPPGLYGTSDAFTAINLFNGDANLKPLDISVLPTNTVQRAYTSAAPFNLKPWLIAAALLMLALDCLAVLWMAGALRGRLRPAAASTALALVIAFSSTSDGFAQSQESVPDFENTFKTRLAYVRTGLADLDSKSRKGLTGLTSFIASRTSLEPGPPVAVDIASDELAFYSLLYWPVSASSPVPSTEAMGRVDAFMKKGGSVLFDTQDQLTGGFGGTRTSAATLKLREILATLDIPPLEPVPQNHVLTRAFYLLDVFPGRYLDGRLWVETSEDEENPDRPTRQGDGVSSLLITSNDLAGAWAVEASGSATFPIVPPNPTQRTYAYRTGVNIVMYTLTGNYKSDQVHIPALLERLGQ